VRRVYDAAPPGSINLGLGEPDFYPPEIVRREAARVVQDEQNGYTANAGLPELRERIAAYHRESAKRPYTPDSVCVTNGAEEALFAVTIAAAGPGDEVLLPDPGFLAYAPLAQIAGALETRYKLPAPLFGLDRKSFEQSVTPRTRLVFLHSPSNPTGLILGESDLEFIAAALSGSNAVVVADEIYRELYYDTRPRSISELFDNTVIISGLSKMMSMTGWRIGWAVGPDDVISHVTIAHQYISTCASSVSQKAAIAAFSDDGRRATAAMREELRARRDVMTSAIERELRLPFVRGEGAFYVMLDISSYGPSEEVAMSLLREGVVTVPGAAFGSEGEGFLRLSFSIQPELIEEGVRRLAKGLSRLKTSLPKIE
jgi:aspartate/methionine/tyrosine aminotransferase